MVANYSKESVCYKDYTTDNTMFADYFVTNLGSCANTNLIQFNSIHAEISSKCFRAHNFNA